MTVARVDDEGNGGARRPRGKCGCIRYIPTSAIGHAAADRRQRAGLRIEPKVTR